MLCQSISLGSNAVSRGTFNFSDANSLCQELENVPVTGRIRTVACGFARFLTYHPRDFMLAFRKYPSAMHLPG